MLLKELLSLHLAEKIIQVGDKKAPMGAPTVKARAFDTNKERNRSVLKKSTGKYQVIEFTDEGENIQVLVMRSDIDDKNYKGINVVFYPDGEVKCISDDKISRAQIKDDEDKIIDAARVGMERADTPHIYDGLGGKSVKRGKGELSFSIKK